MSAKKSYFSISDQVSINVISGTACRHPTGVSRFRIIEKEGIRTHRDCKHLNFRPLWDAETASISKTGCRLLREFLSRYAPNGWFDRENFTKFDRETQNCLKLLKQAVGFDVKTEYSAFHRLIFPGEFTRTSRFHFKLLLEPFAKFLASSKNSIDSFAYFHEKVVSKLVSNLEISGFESRKLKAQLRPTSAAISISSSESVCLSLESAAAPARPKSQSLAGIRSEKYAPLAEPASRIMIRVRRKKDPVNLLSVGVVRKEELEDSSRFC